MPVRNRALPQWLAIGALCACPSAFAAADGSQLEAPKGSKVAIVAFENLENPDCAAAHPDLVELAKSNKVPLVVHDVATARDTWAFPAAILVRYFDTLALPLGADFRSYAFKYQPKITAANLRSAAEKFAAGHNVLLPPEVDASGHLKAQVDADVALGRKIQLQYLPTIFVVGPGKGPGHVVEVSDLRTVAEIIASMNR
jgi:protein-disulfide isomerase